MSFKIPESATAHQGATRCKNSQKLSKNSKRDQVIVFAHPPQWGTMPILSHSLFATIPLLLTIKTHSVPQDPFTISKFEQNSTFLLRS